MVREEKKDRFTPPDHAGETVMSEAKGVRHMERNDWRPGMWTASYWKQRDVGVCGKNTAYAGKEIAGNHAAGR